MAENILPSGSPVVNFYSNRSIFITGATGFMGKILVEKLLRSTNVKKLYLLIRPKKGVQTVKRLEDLLSSKVFQGLRETQPGVFNKVDAIEGDITEPGLGIGSQDEAVLAEEVSVVFHNAATIKFDEAMKLAVAMNVEAVLSLIKLCKKMKQLESLVHVSTAYCNCDLTDISEEIYPPPASPQGMIDLCKWMDEEKLHAPQMTSMLIGKRPNTYTFTKALAEAVLQSEAGGLPVAIVRPSIVVSAWKEPLPGWVDNLNGPTGLMVAAGKGVLKTLYCHQDMVADLIPVDITINLMCSVAWRTSQHPSNDIPVYNCTSGSLNPIKWKEIDVWGVWIKHPLKSLIWYPGGSFKSSDWANKCCQYLFHIAPAFLADSGARMIGRKPMMLRIYEKIHKASKTLEYFTTHEWRWTNDNVLSLQNQLTEADKTVFNFNVAELNWPDFIDDYVKGTKQYVFNEDKASLPASKRQLRKMYWVNTIVQILVFIMFWNVLLCYSETASSLWNFFIGLIVMFARMLLPIGNDI